MSTLLKCPFPHPQLGRLGFARQPSGFWVLLSWPRMDSEQVDQSGQNTAPTSAAEARDEAEIGREGAVPGATDKIAPGPDVQNEEHDAPDDPNGSKAGGDASVTAQWTGAALQSMLWGLSTLWLFRNVHFQHPLSHSATTDRSRRHHRSSAALSPFHPR
eukprot:m.355376 g.355376  ORF g.355376 m.355376 type:complete len:159 (-) comp16597_c1_seq36:3630-4106(-)